MTIQNYPNDKIHDNPYQVAGRIDPAEVAELADSIKEHGLKRVPTARQYPGKPGHVQIIEGHRRRAAWFLQSKEPMPLDVLDSVEDRLMFENNAIENAHRQDLNAIQKATQMQAYINTFGATQMQAGKLFGIERQGSVSNVLRLLKLPAAAQNLVASRVIPERDARRLLPLTRAPGGDKAIIKIVQDAAKAEDEDRSGILDNSLHHELRKLGSEIDNSIDLDWPPKPIPVIESEWTKGAPKEIPACTGCEFLTRSDGDTYCLRPQCLKIKERLWCRRNVEKAAKKLGIPMQAKGEKVTIIYAGEYELGKQKFAERALKVKDKAKLLRLVSGDDIRWINWQCEHLLGNGQATLATTDLAALKKALPAEKKTAAQKVDKARSAWEREAEKKRERAKFCVSVIDRAVPHFTSILPDNPALVGLLFDALYPYENQDKQRLRGKDLRLVVMRQVLLEKVPHGQYSSKATPENATKTLTALAKSLKVKLPRGWNAAPSTNGKTPAAAKPKAKEK